ncbi:MAG: hypothetical protein JOZ75_08485, partial [Candidatus Dormibacteraeota bacterium]|nr:hypothetical protein [Candidatus Dormibacteraeota bacterium]
STNPAPTSSPSTNSAPATPLPTGETATLSNSASGTTTYVRVGAVVYVTLTDAPPYRFTAPSSSDQTVLGTVASTQTAAEATAEFRALQPGTATISATENPVCLPQCGLPSRLWGATVVVTPHPVP